MGTNRKNSDKKIFLKLINCDNIIKNSNSKIQIQKFKFKNSNSKIQIQKFKFKNSNSKKISKKNFKKKIKKLILLVVLLIPFY
jgi:hypothetical protein